MQEVQVAGSIEDGGLAIVEAGTQEIDSAQDLHALAFAGDGDLGRMTEAVPGSGTLSPDGNWLRRSKSAPDSRCGLFFKAGIKVAMPAVLLAAVGTGQHPAGPLHEKPKS